MYIVLKELNANNGTSPQTYTPCSAHMEHLIAEYENFLSRQNNRISVDMKQLPAFYWLPKLHKNSIDSRFIAASNTRTTKPLSQLLTSSLKLIAKHFRQYCEGIARNTGVNNYCFCIIDNTAEVLKKLTEPREPSILVALIFPLFTLTYRMTAMHRPAY